MPRFFSNIFKPSRSNSHSRSPNRSLSQSSAASLFLYDPTVDDPTRLYETQEKELLGHQSLSVPGSQCGLYGRNRSISSTTINSHRNAIECNSDVSSNPPPPYASSNMLNVDAPMTLSRSGTVSGKSRTSKWFDTNYYRNPLRKESMENAYDILRKFNTVILVDDSYSMLGDRWREAGDALSKIADIASKFDDDGIDIYFLNSQECASNMKSSEAVLSLFDRVQPSGATWLGQKLDCLLREYLNELDDAKAAKQLKNVKPINYVVLTDGRPDDQLDLEKSIVDVARRLDQGNYPLTQVGIQLVQIGRSKKATDFLKELDDSLERRYRIRDIVDTTPYFGAPLSSDALIKIMLGGISRKIDAM